MSQQKNSSANKTILLVEDDAVTAMTERKMLEKHHYRVLHAANGVEALEIAETNLDIDLVLMDLELGQEPNGAETAASIHRKHHLPIVFLSRHTEAEYLNKIQGIDHYGYFLKDYGEAVLLESLHMAFKRIQIERKQQEHEFFLSNILDSIQDGLAILDPELNILSTNRKINEWFSRQLPLEGKKCHEVFRDRAHPCRTCPVQRSFITHKLEKNVISDSLAQKVEWLELTATPLKNKEGKITGMVEILRDISEHKRHENHLFQQKQRLKDQRNELKRKNRKLQEAAIRDSLTGLYNHGHIHDILQSEIDKVQRYDRSLSILMLDLDFFKEVNDTYGHKIGDKILVTLAQAFFVVLRETDSIGRYGGEEFLVVMPESNLSQACSAAERLRQHVAQIDLGTAAVTITVSIGAAQYQKEDINKFIQRADRNLYQAKDAGRNCVFWDSE